MTVIKKYNDSTSQWEAIAVGQKGDTGEGVASGGTTNQILTKLSNDDFDTQWVSDIDVTSVTQDKSVFNIPVSAFSPANAGEVQWNVDEGTLDIGLDGAISLHVGQETLYYVKNQTGSQINVGTLVCASGTLGNSGRILITPWTGAQPIQTIMGLTTENIANGEDGYVTHFGKLRGVNTTGSLYSETWANGDILYAGPSGGLTKVKPTAPNTKTIIALVINAASDGTLFIRPTLSSSIGDDDLVEITSISDNDILRYNSANGRFENESLGTAADADTGDFATAAQGSLADTAVQPGDIGTIASQDANNVNIDGGTIDGTAVNATTLTASGDVNFDSGTLFVQSATNRVGIGTTSPASMLTLKSSAPFIRLERDFVNTWQIQQNQISTQTGFSINDVTAGTTPFFISQNSGNVGIGTTSPSSQVNISSSVQGGAGSDLALYNDSLTAGGFVRLRMGRNPLRHSAIKVISTTSNGRNNDIVFEAKRGDGGDDTTFEENMRITSSGNVLIGTTVASSDSSLKVSRPSGDSGIRLESGSVGNGQLCFFQAAGQNNRFFEAGVYNHSGLTNPSAYCNFTRQDGVFGVVWVDDSGNFRISNTYSHIGTTSGTVVGTQTSDERIKNIEGAAPYGLSAILQLEPVKYALKSEPDTPRLGFTAQQVRDIIPESVFDTDESMGEGEPTKLGMEYVQIIPVLVNAIKELKAELDKLKG